MFLPNQHGQQIVLAKIQDGAHGGDLPDKEKTATQDFSKEEPRENVLP